MVTRDDIRQGRHTVTSPTSGQNPPEGYHPPPERDPGIGPQQGYPQQGPQQGYPQQGYPQQGGWQQPPPEKKRKRVFMWFFLAVQLLFLIWIIAGVAGNSSDHSSCSGLSTKDCQSAKDAGTAIGVGLIIIIWAAVDIILGFIYLIVRVSRRN